MTLSGPPPLAGHRARYAVARGLGGSGSRRGWAGPRTHRTTILGASAPTKDPVPTREVSVRCARRVSSVGGNRAPGDQGFPPSTFSPPHSATLGETAPQSWGTSNLWHSSGKSVLAGTVVGALSAPHRGRLDTKEGRKGARHVLRVGISERKFLGGRARGTASSSMGLFLSPLGVLRTLVAPAVRGRDARKDLSSCLPEASRPGCGSWMRSGNRVSAERPPGGAFCAAGQGSGGTGSVKAGARRTSVPGPF